VEFVAITLGVLGALGWGLFLGERQRCKDLRSMLTFGTPAAHAETGVFPPAAEPEDAAALGVPQITEAHLRRGADDLIAIAKANGVELSEEAARQQAMEMMTAAYGFN
jgi:hypothetical protein